MGLGTEMNSILKIYSVNKHLLKLDTRYCTSVGLVKDEQSMVPVSTDSFTQWRTTCWTPTMCQVQRGWGKQPWIRQMWSLTSGSFLSKRQRGPIQPIRKGTTMHWALCWVLCSHPIYSHDGLLWSRLWDPNLTDGETQAQGCDVTCPPRE